MILARLDDQLVMWADGRVDPPELQPEFEKRAEVQVPIDVDDGGIEERLVEAEIGSGPHARATLQRLGAKIVVDDEL